MLRATMLSLFALAVWSVSAAPAWATFHLWKIQEVYSNADGSVQFIELISPNPSSNEHLVANHPLRSNARTFNIPTNLPSPQTSGKTFLVATPGFAALPGAVTPDYTFASTNFFSTVADTLRFDTVDTFAFTAGQLPTNGLLSRVNTTPFAVSDNYTNILNSPKNFAGQTGSLFILGDLNGDALVNRVDVFAMTQNFGRTTGATRQQGDMNADGAIGLDDLAMLQARLSIGTASPAAVPEPSTLALAAMGVGAAAWRTARKCARTQGR